MIKAALDAGINFIDTAPVYGNDGAGETILARLPRARATTSCSRRRSATTSPPSASSPASRERPHDWRPESVRAPGRGLAAPARHRPHRPAATPQPAHRADRRRRAVGDARRAARPRARSASSASRSARRSVGSKKATARSTTGRSCRCRPCSTSSSRNRASRSRARPRVENGEVGLIARVPHASDTLSGKITPDTVFPPGDHRAHRNRDNMLDNFEKAETLGVPLGARDRPHDRPGRDRRHPRQPGVRVRAADRALGRRGARVRGGVRPAAHRATKRERSTTCGSRNFDHVDRYVDAAEVERLDRRVSLGSHAAARRPTPPPAARSRARALRATGLPRDLDGRDRGSGRRHQAGAVPALPEQARALRRAARGHRPPAAHHARRGDRAAAGTRASASSSASARTSSSRSATAPAFRLLLGTSIRSDPEFARIVEEILDAAARDDLDADRDPGPTEQRLVLANALVGMARVGRAGARCRIRRRDVDADQLAQWISELAWFGLRGVRPTRDAAAAD